MFSDVIAVYGDGGVCGKNPSEIGGTYAWCHIDIHGSIVRGGVGLLVPQHLAGKALGFILSYPATHYQAGDLKREVIGVLPAAVMEGFGPVEWSPRHITNNMTEYLALLCALEDLPDGWSGDVCSDSEVTIGRIFRGWRLRNIESSWAERCSATLARLGTINPIHLDGHPTMREIQDGIGKRGSPVSVHNVWCDRQCAALALAWHRYFLSDTKGASI